MLKKRGLAILLLFGFLLWGLWWLLRPSGSAAPVKNAKLVYREAAMEKDKQFPISDPLGGAGMQAPEREIRYKAFEGRDSNGKGTH